MSDLTQPLISALATALATAISFAVGIGVAWLLRRRIRDIIVTTGLTRLKAGEFEAEFDAQHFAQAAYRKQGMGPPSAEDVREIDTLVRSFGRFVVGRRILWVDNHPENNGIERGTLEDRGVQVATSLSTEEAMDRLLRQDRDGRPFDLVISDWYRGGAEEGPKLAELMHQGGSSNPVLFYFAVDTPGQFSAIRERARELHAVGATSSPRELLRWTFAELMRAALRDPRTVFVWSRPS